MNNMNLRLGKIFSILILVWSSFVCFAAKAPMSHVERSERSPATMSDRTINTPLSAATMNHEAIMNNSDNNKEPAMNNVISMQDSIDTQLAGDIVS